MVVVRFYFLYIFGSSSVCFLSSLGGRDARPCVTSVQSSCCPASALICIEPGPLGDASGRFSLVLASVNVIVVAVASGMWLTVCESIVK